MTLVSETLPPAIAEVVRLWIARVESPHSKRAYLRDVTDFVAFAELAELADAKLADLVDWRDALAAAGNKPATIARRLAAIGSLTAFAVASEAIPRNFALLVRKPKCEKYSETRYLPWDYVAMMFAAADTDRDRAALRVLYYAGIRNEELGRLRWRSLAVDDRGRGVLSVLGKGDKRRYVLIPAFLYGALIRLRGTAGDDAPMFLGRRGGALGSHGIHGLVARIARRARVPGKVSPHWLRHAHVSHALDGRAPIALVQRDAGHASLETTGRYAHSRPDDGSSLYLPIA